jgi:alpha-amylase
MTGEWWGHGVERDALFDSGFDNLINFDFQAHADHAAAPLDLDTTFAAYARALAAPASYNVLSYISSHDTHLFDRARLELGAEALLLAPGGVQIFYGDETRRPEGPGSTGDPQQATRSDMNWDRVDTALLTHWRRLGAFRARHVALARGHHEKLSESPYVFSRIDGDDRVVVALGAKGTVQLPVGSVFADGTSLRDAYGGGTATVKAGRVEIAAAAQGVVLLEPAP